MKRTREQEKVRIVDFVRRHASEKGTYMLIDGSSSGVLILELVSAGKLVETSHGKAMQGMQSFPRNSFFAVVS